MKAVRGYSAFRDSYDPWDIRNISQTIVAPQSNVVSTVQTIENNRAVLPVKKDRAAPGFNRYHPKNDLANSKPCILLSNSNVRLHLRLAQYTKW